MGWQAQVVDASLSDQTAGMILLIPGMQGTDMNALDVVVRDGEEWIRWGGYLHRPLETMPVLSAATTSKIALGPEGFAEWRSVQLKETSSVSVSLSGARAWRLYYDDFQTQKSGGQSDQPVLPAGKGLAYLMLFGDAGSSVTVTVP
jgi:hypothetical protein